MKNRMKHRFLFPIITVMTSLCLLCGCGSSAEKIEGDWTVKSINGKSPADFASDNRVYELGTAKNYSFTDKKLTVEAIDETGKTDSKSYDIKQTDEGVDVLAAGSTISMEYMEAENLIKYSVNLNDVQYQYILKKGRTDLESLRIIKADKQTQTSADESIEPEGSAPAADISAADEAV